MSLFVGEDKALGELHKCFHLGKLFKEYMFPDAARVTGSDGGRLNTLHCTRAGTHAELYEF